MNYVGQLGISKGVILMAENISTLDIISALVLDWKEPYNERNAFIGLVLPYSLKTSNR